MIIKRSHLAFVLTPERPIFESFAKLDERTSQFAGYFVSKPVVLDLSAVRSSNAAIGHLISELQTRDIRVMGLQGIERSELGPDSPSVLLDSRRHVTLQPEQIQVRMHREASVSRLAIEVEIPV